VCVCVCMCVCVCVQRGARVVRITGHPTMTFVRRTLLNLLCRRI
jgi:hypothetical protein